MKPLQNIECSPEQLSIIYNIYTTSPIHEMRQRGHTIILRNKGYGLDFIASVLDRNLIEIEIIIKAFFYFGFEGLNNFDYEDLLKKN